MSSFQALALILGATIFGVYVLGVLQKECRAISLALQSGVEDGVPITPAYRWTILWSFYVPALMYGFSLATVGAFGFVQVGMNVADPKIRMLAYLCAGGAGLSSIFWALGGLNGVIYASSILRKAPRE